VARRFGAGAPPALAPIKFRGPAYAPFASAIPVTNPRSLGAPVHRYITAVGRLSANQCALLARPWHIEDELSTALTKAVAGGGGRTAEEAAALAAVVTGADARERKRGLGRGENRGLRRARDRFTFAPEPRAARGAVRPSNLPSRFHRLVAVTKSRR